MIPCKDGPKLPHGPGEFIHQIHPYFEDLQYVDCSLGQPLILSERAIKQLITSNSFSEAELYKPLAPLPDGFDFWETEREIYDWEENLPEYDSISLARVHVLEHSLVSQRESKKSLVRAATDNASKTSLKVIALLMHHLAKSPKYASGTSPNKSQIKELLLELASELGIDPYGLNKVDERLLSDAMKYLEEQKL